MAQDLQNQDSLKPWTFTIEKAMDFHDEDIEFVRAERKYWANRDQDPTLDKAERKEAQRWVKVCTLVLECMTGMKGGKWESEPLRCWPDFPLELQEKIKYLFMQATGDRKPYAKLLEEVIEEIEHE